MSEDVDFEVTGKLGRILLNRPKALNALTLDMCRAIRAQLAEWSASVEVDAVLVEGEGERAFCAGGDVVALYKSGLAWKGGDEASLLWREFFVEEYKMNAAIHHFTKPYIAILDGIVMGGGVGVSVHGSHRIATERTLFAMPETSLGLMPDVGGSYFLPRLAGAVGMYLALTGARMKAGDTCATGVTQVTMNSANIPALRQELGAQSALDQNRVDDILEDLADDPGAARIPEHSAAIDQAFGAETLDEVFANLADDRSDWAAKTLARLQTKSPSSMRITFRQLQEGARLRFDDCMRMEFRIVNRILGADDFYEGVRAILLDKDNAPLWNPSSLEALDDAAVAGYFEPLGALELEL